MWRWLNKCFDINRGWKIEKGDKINFSTDRWLGKNYFKDRYRKDGSVDEYGT